MMKVLERLIRKQLVNFLSVHNLFNPNQHGFRHGRSCLSALLDVYDNMMTSLSNNPKSSVDMIYLDYAKAFDKVDHGVLLNKLKTFGICGKLGEWLHSFLTNRRHHVRIPGGVSKSDSVLSGVPQGTVLGPVLFLVLIIDWRQCGNSLALCYFAVVMELPDSLWMHCKSEFGVIFLRCSPR